MIRAGLLESRGGAGVDYVALKDRLRFSGDVWDFNRPDDFAAHAKVTARYYLTPSLFVTGGWDDFLNRETRGGLGLLRRRPAVERRRHQVPAGVDTAETVAGRR